MYKIINPPYESLRQKTYNTKWAAAREVANHFDREQHTHAINGLRKIFVTTILPLTKPFAVLEYRFTLQFERVKK